jgi:hypothetical protein
MGAFMSERMPEIFIVGTMKGGTTILYDYLLTHPRVVRGTEKEIHYFSLHTARGDAWYADQFPDRAEDVYAVDASPTYFDAAFTTAIPGHIKALVPNAKLILIVRDPIERAISHFQHLQTVSHKDLFCSVDINDFFARAPENCIAQLDAYDYFLNQCLSFSAYYRQLLNYLAVFERDRLLILRNEELRGAAASTTMRRVFSHCDLEWIPSTLFGQERYLSGSQRHQLASTVRNRLANILYPNFKHFCAAAGLPYSEKIPA